MSGSGGDGAGGGAGGFDLSSLLGKSGTGASQFAMPGGDASQFTMPGGAQGNYQGVSMMPAALGGVQGVADAQDYSKMLQDASGMSAANYAQLAAAAGGGNLQAPGGPQAPQGMAGARGGGGGAQQTFTPQLLSQLLTQAPTQGTANITGGVNTGAAMSQPVQNLLKLLQTGNAGFALK